MIKNFHRYKVLLSTKVNFKFATSGDGERPVATGNSSHINTFGSRTPKFKSLNFYIFKYSLVLVLSLISILLSPLSASAALTDGLVGWWTFDGKDTSWSKNQTYDMSGSGNTVSMFNTSTSTTPTSGKVGQAFYLKIGTNYLQQTANTSSLKMTSTQDFSYGGWFKPMSDIDSPVLTWDGGSVDRWFLNIDNFGTESFACSINLTTTDANAGTGSITINTGQWYHLFCVYDDTAKVSRLYINGFLAATGSAGSGTITDGGGGVQSLLIGSAAPSSVTLADVIDDVRIYNRQLSANEVQQLYKLGSSKVAASTSVAPTNPLFNGLVGWWTFDGKDTNWSKNQTYDRSGNGNTGTMTNMSTTTSPARGKIGQAMTFDGINDILAVNDNNSLDGMAQLTLAAWVYRTGDGGGSFGRIFEKNDGADYKLIYGGSNQWSVQINSTFVAFGANSAPKNRWQHVVSVYDGTTVTNYIDGIINSTSNAISGNVAISSSPLYVGTNGAGSRTFDGKIDDARIYNRVLSANEVQQLYKLGSSKVAASTSVAPTNPLNNGLVGWWTFDGKDTNWSKNQTYDRSGNGNTGTMTSMSTTSSPVVGKVGQGFNFDGSNDGVLLGAPSSLNITGNVTVSSWVYITAQTAVSTIFDKTNGSVNGYRLYYRHNPASSDFNKLVFVVNTNVVESSDNVVAIGKWQQVTVTYDQSNVRFYVNGVLVSSSILTDSINSNSNGSAIGSTAASAEPFGGKLDDVRVYNRALSANEVQQLYKLGSSKIK